MDSKRQYQSASRTRTKDFGYVPLKARGEVVAIPGDGVNVTLPSNRQIGIAIGEPGTDVARESAAFTDKFYVLLGKIK